MKAKVYFVEADDKNASSAGAKVLKMLIKNGKIKLEPKLPIKIHPGAIGNTGYLKPEIYKEVVEAIKKLGVSPFFIETCMEAGTAYGKIEEFEKHGFNFLPYEIADGENGTDEVKVEITKGSHFKFAYIADKLANAKQVLVISHFKGHGMAGFGGAIKMLGIGFASGHGKSVVHSKVPDLPVSASIDWSQASLPGKKEKWLLNWNPEVISTESNFRERVAEYATAAVKNKQNIYLNFAINIVEECDCVGRTMKPVYEDAGVFGSTDPVAIDKAVFDVLSEREGEEPFAGKEIFGYAERLGLGSVNYELIKLRN